MSNWSAKRRAPAAVAFPTTMTMRAIGVSFLACIGVLLPWGASAFESPCSGEPSHLAEDECLFKEYKARDALLRRKVSLLLQAVAKSESTSTYPPELVREHRARLAKAVQVADKAWRELVAAECGALVEEQSFGGNGGQTEGTACKISRTNERIRYLETSEEYRAWVR